MAVKSVSWTDLIEHTDERGQPMIVNDKRSHKFKLIDARDWEAPTRSRPGSCDCLIHSKRGPKRREED